jgi:hypothetical protein
LSRFARRSTRERSRSSRHASSADRTFLKPGGTRTGSIARSLQSLCRTRFCRGCGSTPWRDGWRKRS